MIIAKSKEMMRRSFEKTIYRFREVPEPHLHGCFGVYVHVPFCRTKCAFCPFYKELLSESRKSRYLGAVTKEIELADMEGRANWVYFGGGTPNTLTTRELGTIVERIRGKVEIERLGIELLPALLTDRYLEELSNIGFTKVSVGVESFAAEVTARAGRTTAAGGETLRWVEKARALGLWVNVDLLVGLPGLSAEASRRDLAQLLTVLPDQITIYPFMVLRGIERQAAAPSEEQFRLIEEANAALAGQGYRRESVWTYALGNDIYDSSRDELIGDYVGFGPAAFSTYGGWKVVNPELDVYLADMARGVRRGFVAPQIAGTEQWRRLARALYDLNLNEAYVPPASLKPLVWLLRLAGYSRRGRLTKKGRLLSHEVTKTVVESLAFPVQNPACVANYDEYTGYAEAARAN